MFGSALHAELESVQEDNQSKTKAKRERILQAWIPETATSKRYADPADHR